MMGLSCFNKHYLETEMKSIKQNHTRLKGVIFAIIAMFFATSLLAQQNGGDRGAQRGQRGAPPEALEACKGLSIDEACEFTSPHGSVSGSCFQPPEDQEVLACLPSDHDESRRRENTN
jgi:hypothetical protein